MSNEDQRHHYADVELAHAVEIAKIVESKIHQYSNDEKEKQRKATTVNMVTVVISLLGVFLSYAIFWKDGIEQTESIKNNIEIIMEKDLPLIHESMRNLRDRQQSNENLITIMSGDIQFTLNQMAGLKKDLKEHIKEDEHYEKNHDHAVGSGKPIHK